MVSPKNLHATKILLGTTKKYPVRTDAGREAQTECMAKQYGQTE
jgi:hypothetical protein